ncbi:hypothetical protein [Tolypothrix sp. VBCCA 56010]|uniref:hypothetical protein n=1 Tax=Tolypothrix sp. VBCCA 56010 TaxID=3137731 RepID=UPI003D7F0DBE
MADTCECVPKSQKQARVWFNAKVVGAVCGALATVAGAGVTAYFSSRSASISREQIREQLREDVRADVRAEVLLITAPLSTEVKELARSVSSLVEEMKKLTERTNQTAMQLNGHSIIIDELYRYREETRKDVRAMTAAIQDIKASQARIEGLLEGRRKNGAEEPKVDEDGNHEHQAANGRRSTPS